VSEIDQLQKTDLAEKAIRSYSDSTKAWQRFLNESSRAFGPGLTSELRAVLQIRLGKSDSNSCPEEISIILGCILGLPWDSQKDEREDLLNRFCESWLDSRPTPPRLDVIILLLEGYGRRLPAAIANKHLITKMTNNAMVSDPGISNLLIAIAVQNGLTEGDLLR
jgi:hypothetical protein